MIKYTNKKVIEVSDFDKLVKKTYGKPYSFQQQDGCKSRGTESISTNSDRTEDFENDTIPEVINGKERGVSFEAWLKKDPNSPLNPTKEQLINNPYYWGKTEKEEEEYKNDKRNINMFWQRSFYPDANMIAIDLHKKGLIEEGDYTIDIDW